MKATSKETGDRRKAERRTPPEERRADLSRGVAGERRVVENRGVAEAMVDALEDILQWERASERAIRIAQEATSSKLSN